MIYQSSDKKMVQVLIEQCCNYGIKHAIISPGSRNAPLIIAFDNHPYINCYSIPDERSAAFYALGIARQLNEPVALICTSGTAVLNYGPALTEAFYQEIPLIAITADRPPELIDQEDGQTIRQHEIFANHIRYSTTLSTNEDKASVEHGKKQINEALLMALSWPQGPVHINIPFEEPLYHSTEVKIQDGIAPKIPILNNFDGKLQSQFLNAWQDSQKVLILVGVSVPKVDIIEHLTIFSKEKNVVIFAPATSNIEGENVISTIESLFYTALFDDDQNSTPDLLITMGGPIVSKAAKQFLRKNKPKYHFDIDLNPATVNTYQALSGTINCDIPTFIQSINANVNTKNSFYLDNWKQKNTIILNKTQTYLNAVGWSDILVFNTFFKTIPYPIDLHLANSTPVRYAELFIKHPKINYFCNRGTSGIDGSSSTAAGAAMASKKTTVLISGDISFFYDSNAFWNGHVPSNLKIILINNGGGNIFKVIKGPDETHQLESHFVTKQNAKAKKLCEAFGVNYLMCSQADHLEIQIETLLKSTECTVLEVFTPSDASAKSYRDIFTAFKS